MISAVRAPAAALVNPLPMPFEGWTTESPQDLKGMSGMFVATAPSDLMSVTIKPANPQAAEGGGWVYGNATWVTPSLGGIQCGTFRALPANPAIGPVLTLTSKDGSFARVFHIVGHRRDMAGNITGLRLQEFATVDTPAPVVVELNRF
jgi:hypothetical protein